jgi:D-alanine-D-alanine ligase
LEYEVFEASEALSEGAVLSLEEKFLAGEGQNITPARYALQPEERAILSAQVKVQLEKAARVLQVEGYARIDAFVRIFPELKAEVVFIEVNSLPGMTPATCIFHQTALQGYKPYDFIDKILDFSFARLQQKNKKLKV